MNKVSNLTRVEDAVSFGIEMPNGKILRVLAGGHDHTAVELSVLDSPWQVAVMTTFMKGSEPAGAIENVQDLPAVTLRPDRDGDAGELVGVELGAGKVHVVSDYGGIIKLHESIQRFTDKENEILGEAVEELRLLQRLLTDKAAQARVDKLIMAINLM